HRDELPRGDSYVSVLSGGNVDPALFLEILAGDPPAADSPAGDPAAEPAAPMAAVDDSSAGTG
ncbi:MAG: hypothetical protein QOH50_5333, partial [Kribbellaceae bacterium]|nr:hypothetical protein [Kribbellaceae bacterium]